MKRFKHESDIYFEWRNNIYKRLNNEWYITGDGPDEQVTNGLYGILTREYKLLIQKENRRDC